MLKKLFTSFIVLFMIVTSIRINKLEVRMNELEMRYKQDYLDLTYRVEENEYLAEYLNDQLQEIKENELYFELLKGF